MYNKQLGLFIGKIRTRKGISVETLCEGICTQSFLSSIESGKKTTNLLLLEILLQRLGVSEDGYESYLSKNDYLIWVKRYKIINYIESNQIDNAKKELELYKNNVCNNNKLHLQYILHIESKIIVLEQKDYKLAYNKLEQAIKLTVPRINKINLINLILSFKELFLIIECAKLKELAFVGTSSQKIYEKVLKYIEINNCEELIKSKLYTKTVCLVCKYWFLEGKYKEIISYCNKGLEYLQLSGKLYFIPQILKNKRIALEALLAKYNYYIDYFDAELRELKNEYEIVLEWENTINNLLKEYDTLNEPYEWYPYYTREIYTAGSVIKKRRNMLNISQEELSNNICSVVTLSRIENEITTPHPRIVKQLLQRLNLAGELFSACIVSDEYITHRLCDKLEQLLVLNKYDEAIVVLRDLYEKLDMSIPVNKQYFMHKQIIIYKNLNIISQQEALVSLKKILHMTLPKNSILKIPNTYLSKKEIILMTDIAIYQENLHHEKKAINIYNILNNYYNSTNCNISNNIITYELVMDNFSSLLGNIGEFEKSNAIIEKTIYESLKCRRGRFIIGLLYSKAWNMKNSIKEEKMQPNDKKLYEETLRKSYIISCILKDKVLEKFIYNILSHNK